MKRKIVKKAAGAAVGITTAGLLIYGISVINMVNNLGFKILGISRIAGGVIGGFLTPKFSISMQITNPSRVSAYLKGLFLDVYVEVRPNQYILIGSINEPKINTTIKSKDNTPITVKLELDSIALGKMIIDGFGVIVQVLRNGQIPKLRFKGNLLVNKIRKKIDIIYE